MYHPAVQWSHYTNATEHVVDFRWFSGTWDSELEQLSYRSNGDVLMIHLCWTNASNNIVPPSIAEKLMVEERREPDRNWAVRPEQMSFPNIYCPARNISEPEQGWLIICENVGYYTNVHGGTNAPPIHGVPDCQGVYSCLPSVVDGDVCEKIAGPEV